MKKTLKQRFESKINIDSKSGCWIWKGAPRGKDHNYGQMQVGYKSYKANRLSMCIYKNFDLNSIEQINHKLECNNSMCVNPNHLYVGTQSENMQDWHAKIGHFTKEYYKEK